MDASLSKVQSQPRISLEAKGRPVFELKRFSRYMRNRLANHIVSGCFQARRPSTGGGSQAQVPPANFETAACGKVHCMANNIRTSRRIFPLDLLEPTPASCSSSARTALSRVCGVNKQALCPCAPPPAPWPPSLHRAHRSWPSDRALDGVERDVRVVVRACPRGCR